MTSRRKHLVALALGLVLAMGALEIGLRLFNPFGFRLRGEQIRLPVFATYNITNTLNPKLDRRIVHHKNSLGFRGPEPLADFAHALSIVAIGGSTTEEFYLSEGHTWPDVVQRQLAPFFPGVWVNNAGLGGHSTFGHLILLNDYVVNLQPKVALFLIGLNDLLVGINEDDPEALPPNDRSSLKRIALSTIQTRAPRGWRGSSRLDCGRG